MGKLIIDANIETPDDVYQKLIDLHKGLSAVESQKLSAKLILILANHIGDGDVIDQAVRRAKIT